VKNIQPLLKQLDAVADQMSAEATFGFLFINDGSKDGTRQLLHRIFRERTNLRIVDLIHNFGHGAALACGLDHCRGDIAVFMDADQQDTPSTIPALFAAWKQGAKTVVAERGERTERMRWLFHGFYFLLHRVARRLPPINYGTFCLLDRSVVERLRQIKERNRYFPGLVGFSSGGVTAIRADRQSRGHGSSRVGVLGLIQLAITALLSFSNAPVRLVSVLGVLFSALSMFCGFSIVGIKLFTNRAIPGWASLMTTSMFGNGLQLLCLGLIGEYIARIYDEVKERPLYLVDRVLEKKAAKKPQKAA
jgi:dolichol-phosphate mannosyltransferase